MKKTIIASSLAVGLGLVAGNVSHADASENQINKEKLAQLAESNDQSLNQHPIQEGAYNYQFNLNGKTYHFWSDGTYFKWEYNATTNQPRQSTSGASVNVNSHLQQIAQRESGGDIHAINPSSGAAGKYQFLQSTWDSVAPAQYKGVSPAQAPESVQDAAAVKLYNTAGPSQWVTA